MKILVSSIVIGLLVPIGAQLASADQPIRAGTSIQLAAAGDSTGGRDTYLQNTQDEMQQWQKTLHDFSERAEASGQAAGSAANIALNKAWVRAEAEARKLPTVSAAGWASAKTSFERASRELASAWDKIRPQEK
jgi:hypothetical protein